MVMERYEKATAPTTQPTEAPQQDYGWMAGWPEDGEMDERDRNMDHNMDQDMGTCFDHDLEYQVQGAFRVINTPWKSCPEPHLVDSD